MENQKLLKMTEELVNLGSCIDLQEVLIWFTFDNICTMAFGIDQGCLSIDLQEVPFARAFEDATELTLIRSMVHPFVWKPMIFFRL